MVKGKHKGHLVKQNRKSTEQRNVAQLPSQGGNDNTVDENLGTISVPASTSGMVKEVPNFKENLHAISTPRASVEVVAQSQTADTRNKEEARDDLMNPSQITTGLPAKLTPGNLGRKIRLVSNLFQVALLPDRCIFHYDVKIIKWKVDELSDFNNPNGNDKKYRCLNTKLNREVIQSMLDTNQHFCRSYAVYDGKYNLYTPSPLELEFPYETKVFLENENRNPEQMRVFLVQINPVNKKNACNMDENNCVINLAVLQELYHGEMPAVDDIQEALAALETIFRHSPALRYVPIGRNFYHPGIDKVQPLGGGTEIWFGYHQSLRLGQWKPMVNLNTSATTFFQTQTLLKYVAIAYDISYELSDAAVGRLASELRNVKVETYHLGYKARKCIIDVTQDRADRLKFRIKSDTGQTRTVTVSQYFREMYNINLVYPHLPCVQVKPKERNIYLPLEICNIPEGEHSKKELSIDDKRKMIQCTAHPPIKKFSKIMSIRNDWANYNEDEYLKSFGIAVDDQPTNVVGRVLEAPHLIFNKNKTVQPTDGTWNIRNLELYRGATIPSWILISLAPEKWCSHHELENFSAQLQRIGKAAGLRLGKPEAITIIRGYENDAKMNKTYATFREIQKRQIQLTVVVLPNNDRFFYANIKQIAEIELGLLTQCIVSNNAKKSNASTLSNLCLKINGKMGGINHILMEREIPEIMNKPVIVMGADVCHAGITDTTGISVSAVTASLDMILSRFAVICRLQKDEKSKKKSVEIILELKDMVKRLLLAFYQHTNRQKPEKIIFFRDGVSDTQFHEVKRKEVRAIREACLEMGKEYQPGITFITVQKRHHVRLRPEHVGDGVGSEGNVPPGTVVDTGIVHPLHSDFYLCSHQGIKGTSRPAHYTLLEDDNEFTSNDLQTLIYYSCNISFRCSKTISIPVPVHYSDLAAYRTRLRLSALPDGLKIKQAKSGEVLKELLAATELADVIKNTMFFV